MRRQARERQEKREDKRPILKRLGVALVAVVQETARRKNRLCGGSARGNWDPRKG